MNAMGHSVPTTLGVDQADLAGRIAALVPNYMNAGAAMDEMPMHMPLPENTLPMTAGGGPHGSLQMGGMFTTVKIRANLPHGDHSDPGWYQAPKDGTAYLWNGEPPPVSR
jgi:hypothetical protein